METEERVVSANSHVGVHTDLAEVVSLDPPGQGLRLRVSAYASESRLARDMLLLLTSGLVALVAWSLWGLMLHMRRRLAAVVRIGAPIALRRVDGRSGSRS